MKLLSKIAVMLILSAVGYAQTYTYRMAIAAGGATGVFLPYGPLTIVGSKGFGSGENQGSLYQAQLSGEKVESDCCVSLGPILVDISGNLYGEDIRVGNGGKYPYGRVWGVRPGAKWVERDLYHFTGADGWIGAQNAGLILDATGNMWGTTVQGGNNSCASGFFGCGVVFELTNNAGTWSEQVIHAFSGSPDGANPEGGVTFDPLSGTYYGTTAFGGDSACNCGTVFQLTANGDGTWSENIIYTFGASGTTGPVAGITIDSQGNLYGTTYGDYDRIRGMAWEISGGQFSVIAQLPGVSTSALTFDTYGNLWGTTQTGGTYNLGTVFYLTLTDNGWQETVLHNFAGNNVQPADGESPAGGLSMDEQGNLWGTTSRGGFRGVGTFYEVQVSK